jgi:glutaminyl-peptide cyclotransferase
MKISSYRLPLKVFFIILCSLLFSYQLSEAEIKDGHRVIDLYPHDKHSQTEGFELHNGFIYEGTGPCKDGPSSLRKIDLETGKIVKHVSLPSPIFGEGVTIFRNRIIQLTYQSKTGYVYELETFKQIKTFSYDTEGWGLTHDSKNLIMSDGTSTLQFLDPETFEVVKRIQVHDKNGEIRAVNELEYIKGYIYANIFLTEIIKKIDPETGMVVESFNLRTILKGHHKFGFDDPANGIAYDSESDTLLVTGKYWPYIFRIKLSDN